MTTTPKKFCFVLMPFSTDFNDIYEFGIQQSCTEAGAYCERLDKQYFTESMLERIYNQISKADIIIADMTGRNANVFYEVGYAHALGKKVVLLTQNADDIPFDLKHFPHIVYGDQIGKLKSELMERVKWLITTNENGKSTSQSNFELYYNSKNIAEEKVVCSLDNVNGSFLRFTVHNNSLQSYTPGDFKISMITEEGDYLISDPQYRLAKLPDGRLMNTLPKFDSVLYPYEYFDFYLRINDEIYAKDKYGVPLQKFTISGIKRLTFRVFTSSGSRDFEFYLDFDDSNLNNNAFKD